MTPIDKVNVLVDRLRLILKGQHDDSTVVEVIDDLFRSFSIKEDKKNSFYEDLLISHFHVGGYRELPQLDIRERNLPMLGQATVWKSLLEENVSEEYGHIRMMLLNEAFEQLGIPYHVSKRRRREIIYRPITRENGDDSIELDVSDEELVFIDQSGTTHQIRSLGSGVGFLVPVVVALSTIDARLISIEEPECHVHPGWQVALGDLVIQHTKRDCWTDDEDIQWYPDGTNSAWNPNFVIETHSEHLILRILRRIRETTAGELDEWPESLRKACPNGILPKDVAVLYVQPGKSGVEVINMPITPNGDFSRPWPGGFFEERANELF